MTAGLTGGRVGGSFGSGKRRSERAAKGISGRPRLKKRSGEPLQGASARVAWRRWRRGQLRSFLVHRRGVWRPVAAVVHVGGDGPLGCVRRREQRRGRGSRAREGE